MMDPARLVSKRLTKDLHKAMSGVIKGPERPRDSGISRQSRQSRNSSSKQKAALKASQAGLSKMIFRMMTIVPEDGNKA